MTSHTAYLRLGRRHDRTLSGSRPSGGLRFEDGTLEIEDVDMLDGTPLLDIKPYVPAFDERQDVRLGWFADRLGRISEIRSDRRFSEP